MRDSLPQLRASLDGNDQFVSGGHGIIKTAGATRHAERMQKIPVWAFDDQKIKELISSRFPKIDTNQKQRMLAARMVRVIYLYYRTGFTAAQVAEQLNMTLKAVERLLARVKEAMGKPLNPPHCPKKGGCIGASNEDSGADHSIPPVSS